MIGKIKHYHDAETLGTWRNIVTFIADDGNLAVRWQIDDKAQPVPRCKAVAADHLLRLRRRRSGALHLTIDAQGQRPLCARLIRAAVAIAAFAVSIQIVTGDRRRGVARRHDHCQRGCDAQRGHDHGQPLAPSGRLAAFFRRSIGVDTAPDGRQQGTWVDLGEAIQPRLPLGHARWTDSACIDVCLHRLCAVGGQFSGVQAIQRQIRRAVGLALFESL